MVSRRAGQTGIVYLWIMAILLSKGQLCHCLNTGCTELQVTQIMPFPTVAVISWSPTSLPLDQLTVKITSNGSEPLIRTNLLQSGAIFTDLPLSTNLTATVCQNTSLTCCYHVSFTTASPARSLTNGVTQINAHVFYPIRNNQEVVSAQVSWRVPAIVRANRQYRATVMCLNISRQSSKQLDMIDDGMPFQSNSITDSHINIMRFTDGLPVFPLPKDTECLIQLIALSTSGNLLSQSFHQFDTRDDTVNLWTPRLRDLRSIISSDQELPKAVAFDSRHRKMFAVIEGSDDEEPAELLRYTIDSTIDNTMPKLVVKLPSPFEPMAMTYDWLSGVVYIAGRSARRSKILKLVVADDNSSQKEAEVIYVGTNEAKDIDPQMRINPFIGTLSWIEHIDTATTLNIYNINCILESKCLSTMSFPPPVVVAQNESSNCLTIVKEDKLRFYQITVTMNTVQFSETDPCGVNANAFSISDESRITLDGNGGIYIVNSNRVNYITRRSLLRNVSLFNDVNTLLSINPGTQPYPDMIQCLAPTGLTVSASMVSSSSATVSWTATRPMECEGVPTPQLVYFIRFQNKSSDIDLFEERMLMETSTTIRGLLADTMYEVTVMVRNSFTMPGMYLRERNVSFMTSEDTTTSSSTPSLATIPPVNTVPPSDTSPPVNTTQQPETSSALLVVGIGSAVGVMFLLVLIVLVVLGIGCGCFLYQKSKTGGGKDLESNPNDYVHPQHSLAVPAYYETPITQQTTEYSTVGGQYETPLPLPRPTNQFQGGIQAYEEPVKSMSRGAPCEYEVAVSGPGKSNPKGVYTSLNTTSVDRHEYMTTPISNATNETEDNNFYSSVDAANLEKEDYIGSQQYTSLQPPVNSERHIYTPPLQHAPAADKSMTIPQERTYFTLEDTRGTSNVAHTEEEERTGRQETGNEKQGGSKPQEEPVYFTLERESETEP